MANYILNHTGAQIDEGIDAALNIGSRIGTSGPASYRNKLGNCDFSINQLGTSFTIPAGGAYLLATSDLWGVQNNTDQALSLVIQSDNWMRWEGRRINLMRISFGVQPTTGFVSISQRIENCDTLAGKSVCLSYLATSREKPAVSASWTQFFGSGGSTSVYGGFNPAIIPNDTLARYSATTNILDTSDKIKMSGNYLQLTLDIPIRSTTPFFFGLPQLEEGYQGSGIEFVEGAVNIRRCLRRYWRFYGVAIPGYLDTASSTSRFVNIPFPVHMSYQPSIATTGNYTWSVQSLTSSFVVLSSNPGNSTSQATLGSLIADARI